MAVLHSQTGTSETAPVRLLRVGQPEHAASAFRNPRIRDTVAFVGTG